MVTFVTMNNAISTSGLVKRSDASTFQSIVNEFAKIANTIKGLEDSQRNAGQTNPPNFQLAAKGLAELSMEAESAEVQLRSLGKKQLDSSSSQSIGGSVSSSAQHATGITTMIKQGKDYFAKYHVTQVVIQILKANIAQFKSLYTELNLHVNNATIRSYSPSEITFLCKMVDAIAYLDTNQISPAEKSYCATGNHEIFDPSRFGESANGPEGYDSCGNSPTTFFKEAYTSGTLGTSSTSCNSGVQTPNSFSIPSNSLMIKN